MDELSPVKRALLEHRKLKARIQQLELARAEPIAIIGIGCRFPGGAESPAAFWQLLRSGRDAIGEMPNDRWNVPACYDPDPEVPGKSATRFGGYLPRIDGFDAHFFGISPREAAMMDPQQRLLLEVSWEALEHAGLAPDRLSGSATGVFVGIGTNDYLQQCVQRQPLTAIDAYLATGNAHSVAAGRVSYLLGLQGPSIALDTACSSSLVAVHLACESIHSGSCSTALAGGVGLLLSLENYVSLSKARMMAPDGRCKTFDAAADGFVRSEGCGIVVLKRLAAALADHDRVLAVIRGSACNQDGRSNGITAPNGPAQQAVLRAALANAQVAARDVSFIETHGTGTVLGDPIEVESLAAVYGEGRDSGATLALGSVKSNLGHLEAAAGVAGLIKAVLALHHGAIPPNLHFRNPNPHIAWQRFPFLKVPTALTQWDAAAGPRIAGVSAFGFSGTNAHVLLEAAPAVTSARPAPDRPLHLLAVSAPAPAALIAAAGELAQAFEASNASLADLCYSVNTGRASCTHRAAFLASSRPELVGALQRLAAQTDLAETPTGPNQPPLLFIFDAGAVSSDASPPELLSMHPPYREALQRCGVLRTASHRQFAVGYALAALWESWGVRPAAVVGVGVGELTAAVVAGALPLAEALRAVDDPHHRVAMSAAAIPLHSTRDSSLAAVRGAVKMTELWLGSASWQSLLESAAQLHRQGMNLDWRAFDSAYARQRVDVPTSPFMRQRHWFESAEDADSRRRIAPLHSLAVAAAERQAAQVPVDLELSAYATLWQELEALSTHAIVHALVAIGLLTRPNESGSPQQLADRARIPPRYRPLLTRWLDRLVRHDLLQQQQGCYGAPEPLTAADRPVTPTLEQFPVLLDYLERCVRAMPRLITGGITPVEIRFDDASGDINDFFYCNWALARYFNNILTAAVDAIVAAHRGPLLRVLEVGGGTGGTSSSLLPLFAAERTEYWFTDLSQHFLAGAEQRFTGYDFVRYELFDLDQELTAQHLPGGSFDLIVAANSVHACSDLQRALARLFELLAPGGVLLLYEVTRDFDWFEISFVELIQGWRQQADAMRTASPLLSSSRWVEVLQASGFESVTTLPEATSRAQILGHHIIVAAKAEAVGSAREVNIAAASPVAASRPAKFKTVTAEVAPLRERLAAVLPAERYDDLRELVRHHIMRVMRLGDDAPPLAFDVGLMSAGVDSLMAVELRNALQRELAGPKLPATLIFDYPTITDIASLLLQLLDSTAAAPAESATPSLPAAPLTSSQALAAMSEEDAELLLEQKLRVLAE